MMEILKSIDWTQVGPFTALLLLVAVVLLGIAPFAFRRMAKQDVLSAAERKQQRDLEAEERKRDYERESRKDDALIRIVDGTQKLGENVVKLSANVERLTGTVEAFDQRMNAKIDTVEKNLSARIDNLLLKPK